MPRLAEGHLVEPADADVTSVPNGGFIVATDGSHDADGSVRVGLALAQRDGVSVELLSVVEPLPLYDTDAIAIPDADKLMRITRESREAALHAQRDRTHPGALEWPYTVEVGNRVDKIVTCANRSGASLIILGVGAHGMTARLFQRETALRVVRAAHTPVLAVPEHARGVPQSVLAAIDFTASSEHAARAALDLLGGEGTLYLAHVSPRVFVPNGDPQLWDEVALAGVLPQLEEAARRLAPPPGIEVEYALLRGDPAHELLAFAAERQIDLVAVGAHGRSMVGRLVLGSVSTKLVRTAPCWVLVAPPCHDNPPASDPTQWT